jgi:hypothetical protein
MTKIIFTENIRVKESVVHSIMGNIRRYELRRYWTRVSIHSTLVLGTGYSLFPATKLLVANLADSGFLSYFSLIFSDGQYVFGYMGDLMLSLANSLPIGTSIIVLGALTVFINSIKKIFEMSPNLSLYYHNHKIS